MDGCADLKHGDTSKAFSTEWQRSGPVLETGEDTCAATT